MEREKRIAFVVILVMVSLTASVFMVLEAGQFYQKLYPRSAFPYMGFLAAGLNEVFMAIMAGVWLPPRRGKGHPANYLFRFLLLLLFMTTVGGASFNAIYFQVGQLASQANNRAIVEVLRQQVAEHDRSLELFYAQNQRVNSALTVKNQIKTKERLVEALAEQKAVSGLWAEVVFLVVLRFAVQLANLSCVWLAGWTWRRNEDSFESKTPSPSLGNSAPPNLARKETAPVRNKDTPLDLLLDGSVAGIDLMKKDTTHSKTKSNVNKASRSSNSNLETPAQTNIGLPDVPAGIQNQAQGPVGLGVCEGDTARITGPTPRSPECPPLADLASPNQEQSITGVWSPVSQLVGKVASDSFINNDLIPNLASSKGENSEEPLWVFAESLSEVAQLSPLSPEQTPILIAKQEARRSATALAQSSPRAVVASLANNQPAPRSAPKPKTSKNTKVSQAASLTQRATSSAESEGTFQTPSDPPARVKTLNFAEKKRELRPIQDDSTLYALRGQITRMVSSRNADVPLSAFAHYIGESAKDLTEISNLKVPLRPELEDRLERLAEKINHLLQEQIATNW